MPEFPPLIELLFALPYDALRRAAWYYREIADRLEWEAERRRPVSEAAIQVKERVAKVCAAADSAALAISRGEPRGAAVSRQAALHGFELVAIEAALGGAQRRLRERRDAAAMELAKRGLSDAEIGPALKAQGFRASQATVTRAIRKLTGSPRRPPNL